MIITQKGARHVAEQILCAALVFDNGTLSSLTLADIKRDLTLRTDSSAFAAEVVEVLHYAIRHFFTEIS